MATQSISHSVNSKRKVLISTLHPLGGNYGGIIQAFSLQKTIRDLGFDVQTINSTSRVSPTRRLAQLTRHEAYRRIGKNGYSFPLSKKDTEFTQSETRRFVSTKMETIDIAMVKGSGAKKILDATDAIVVGSDQVWRGGYANIPDQLLEFALDYPMTKISYAASFGGDRLIRYSKQLQEKAPRLASEFAAISVREESGVTICKEQWDVSAIQHLDPALLQDQNVYRELIDQSPSPLVPRDGGIFTYILDTSPEKVKIVNEIQKKLSLNSYSVLSPSPSRKKDFLDRPENFRMPSVENWLNGFLQADFVVTDSFHGTVFAILFNKSFISIGNTERGLSRFTSLLNLFGLTSKLVSTENTEFDFSPINWAEVEIILTRERQRSETYLKQNLA